MFGAFLLDLGVLFASLRSDGTKGKCQKNMYHYIYYQNNYISNRTKRKAKIVIFSKPLVLVSATCNVKATGNVCLFNILEMVV